MAISPMAPSNSTKQHNDGENRVKEAVMSIEYFQIIFTL